MLGPIGVRDIPNGITITGGVGSHEIILDGIIKTICIVPH